MKIWLVTRSDQCGYDEYDSFVCVAESEEDARLTHPSGSEYKWEREEWRQKSWTDSAWPSPSTLKAEEIGTANEGQHGVICASFNAG